MTGLKNMEHLHNGILLDYKKENLTSVTALDGRGEYYAK